MVYDPELSPPAYSNPPLSEQNAEDGAGHNQEAPGSPRVLPAAAEDAGEAADASYVWVSSEDGQVAPVIGRTGSSSPGEVSYSPKSPFDEAAAEEEAARIKRNVIGKTYYPREKVDIECTPPVSPRGERTPPVSPRLGRTKGERMGRTQSEAFTAPEGGLKLEPFTPQRPKNAVREDSVPPEEEPAKRLCLTPKGGEA